MSGGPVASGDADGARASPGATAALEEAWREHWADLVATVIVRTRRPDLAEDAAGDAFAAAADRWPVDGVPRAPFGWLVTAAHRRVVDRIRAEAVRARREPLMVMTERARAAGLTDDPAAEPEPVPDDRLALVFACCHPALDPDARVALTLRFVVGLEVAEIARLLLVQPTTMAARLTRAKKRLAASGIPFAVPPAERLDERLDVVAVVLYLMFTAGYQPARGPAALRVDLADEAIRQTRVLDAHLPGRPVLRALLALMLLQHARRDARLADDGALVLLADQDRTRWRADEIDAGLDVLAGLPSATGQAEEYRLQALVAAEHARAATAAATRWDVVAGHYAALEALTGSPVVRLARAVAVAEGSGAEAGLALLEGLERDLPHSHRRAAVRGELLARVGRVGEAAAELRRAVELADADAERAHLTARLRALEGRRARGVSPVR